MESQHNTWTGDPHPAITGRMPLRLTLHHRRPRAAAAVLWFARTEPRQFVLACGRKLPQHSVPPHDPLLRMQ